MIEEIPVENTDKHLWRKSDDAFSPSIHVTKSGAIGNNCAGHVIVIPVEKWHALGELRIALDKIHREYEYPLFDDDTVKQ